MPKERLGVSDPAGVELADVNKQLCRQLILSKSLNGLAQQLMDCPLDAAGNVIQSALSATASLMEGALGAIYLHELDLVIGETGTFWSTSSLDHLQVKQLTESCAQNVSTVVAVDYLRFSEVDLCAGDIGYSQGFIFPLPVRSSFNGCLIFAFTDDVGESLPHCIEHLLALRALLLPFLRRHNAVKSLITERERLRQGQICANIGTWEWDLQTDTVIFSEQMAPLLGLSEAVDSQPREYFTRTIYPADLDVVRQTVIEALESNASYEVEHRVLKPDGAVRWVLERGAVTHDEVGNALTLLGTLQDIHEQKLAQIALEDRQKELKQTQAMAKLGRWTVDLKTGELEVSDEVYDIHGLDPSKDRFTMETGRNAIPAVDYEKLAQMDQQLTDTGCCDLTHRIVCPNGEVRHVYVLTWARKSTEGEVVALDGFIQDVTHRVQLEAHLNDSQKRLAFAIEGFGDAIWDWNLLDNSIEYTGLSKNFLGYDDGELPSEITVLSALLHPDDRSEFSLVHNRCVRGEDESYQQEMRMRCKDGSYKWIMCRATVVERDEKGTAARMIGIHSDITDRKAKEAALTLARDEAERANRAKSEFLSHMSHELRTPMNAILGFGQLLKQDDSLSAEHDDHVNEILNAGKHLLELINEVLDLSKIEAGKLTLSVEAVQVNPVLHEVMTLLEPLAADRNVRLEMSLAESISVMADKIRLKQVMINLLSNAIKYNRVGGRVLVSVQRGGTESVRIIVEDTGVGIDEGALEAIFDPFNRLDAENSEIEGAGIGLALTKALIEMMGGMINVESSPEKGSLFWIDLPQAEPSADDSELAVEAQHQLVDVQARKRKTVLYIDDNPVNLKLVKHILRAVPSIALIEAQSGALGVSIAKTMLPDLVLVDISMPDMDGFQVLDILKQDPAFMDRPIVAVTANAMASDVAKGMAAGFSDYISKPFDISTFTATVCSFLE